MPIKHRKRQIIFTASSILAILFLDQYSKFLTSSKLATGESISVIKSIFHITFVKNTGAAFGLFKNGTVIFILISVAAVVVIAGFILRSIRRGDFSLRPLFNSGLVLIVSGAMGNLIDRLRVGYVIDFIDVRIWPVFNIADTSITIGTIFLVISFILTGPFQQHQRL
ncbi:MAG: signal peptidase II [Candidatus Omnitrophica bacterium]|nr:signal peptidase II [Candidatus Omnitrophota bacterium]